MTEAQAIQTIELVKRGNTNAFEKLVLHYQNMVFSFIYTMVQNQMDAEELTQDVFVKAYRKLELFRGDAKFSTWLFTIARNNVSSSFRKKQLDTIDVDDSKTAHFQVDEVDSAFDLLSIKERNGALELALEQLAPQQKMLLQLFYLEEQSLKEIEEITGLSNGSIKTGLMRARNNLYTVLTEKMAFKTQHDYGN